jgi:hypothetical protein
MAFTNAHLNWFELKCPYPKGSKAFRIAKAKLENATYRDLERLCAEFEMYQDGSKYRVQKRINVELRRWTYDTLAEAVKKRDTIFSKVAAE